MNADNWIAHLQHPLVLAGFGLFVFALVIRPLFSSSSKLSGAAIERILHRGMILLFILAITAILAGVMLSWKVTPTADRKDTVKPTPEFHSSSGKMSEDLNSSKEQKPEPPSASVVMPKMAVVSVRRLPVQSLSPSALSPLPPAPPAMNTVSVSRQPVPSLLQRKLHPLPKAEKMLSESRTIGQYIDHGDCTITDSKTGLRWKRCQEGLSGVNCEDGKVEGYTWDQAVRRFKNVAYAGYSDWRLPTIDELKTLVHCSKGIREKKSGRCNEGSEVPTINQQVFPNNAYGVWSGSPSADDPGYGWCVVFNVGLSSSCEGTGAVRLVRGGQ